jgi:DNA polymerase III subunit delta'
MSDDGETFVGLPLPAANPDLIGHEAAEALILEAWSSGRMPHAWLIAGPPGIGKATLAYRIARFVLSGGGAGADDSLFGMSEAPPTSMAIAPDTRVARMVAAESHPDLKILRRQMTDKGTMSAVVKVEEVRAFEASLRFKSAEGGWRVAIVDEADRMNRNAENALLKILEEPPVNTLILLISNALNSMLPTTRSRCRRLVLKPLPDPLVLDLLRRARPSVNEADASVLVRLAEGSIGRAIALADAGGADLYRGVAGLMGHLPVRRGDLVPGETLHALATAWGRRPKAGEADAFSAGMELMLWWIDRAVRSSADATGLQEVIPGDLAVGRRWVASAGVEPVFRRRAEVERLIHLERAVNLDRRQVVLDSIHTLALGDGLDRGRVAE